MRQRPSRDAIGTGELDPGEAGAQQPQRSASKPGHADAPCRPAYSRDSRTRRRPGRRASMRSSSRKLVDMHQGVQCANRTAGCARPAARWARAAARPCPVFTSTMLSRAPRTPASCSATISRSLASSGNTATPRNAPLPATQRGDHRAVVGAVEAWLHQHGALAAERREQMPIGRQQRLGRRIDALRNVAVGRLRAADGMAVAGERGTWRVGRAAPDRAARIGASACAPEPSAIVSLPCRPAPLRNGSARCSVATPSPPDCT